MISEQIHPEDLLYRYIVGRWGAEEGHKRYLEGGLRDAHAIMAIADRLRLPKEKRVLEFASGYGRVTRNLSRAAPSASFVASDIHPKAIEFITGALGVPAFVSATDPADLKADGEFDFIFVLSLFSHLPHRTFSPWLNALYSLLRPEGQLVFTTHGDNSKKLFAGIDLSKEESGEGWIYRRASDQPDLDAEDYGTMLVTPQYVLASVDACGGMLTLFESGSMMGHQDLWGVKRR